MRKGFIKGIVVGCALTFALVWSVAAYGQAVRREIAVIYNNIRIILDGREFIPRDGDGNEVEPFTFEGTAYVPINTVAQALGRSLDWDSETNTFYIGGVFRRDQATHLQNVTLLPGATQRGAWVLTGQTLRIRNNEIQTMNSLRGGAIVSGQGTYTNLSFLLDPRYGSLTAMFGVTDGSQFTGQRTVEFVDIDTDRVIARFSHVPNEHAIPVEVNLVGVDKLRIRLSGPHGWDTAIQGVLFDIELHPIAEWTDD